MLKEFLFNLTVQADCPNCNLKVTRSHFFHYTIGKHINNVGVDKRVQHPANNKCCNQLILKFNWFIQSFTFFVSFFAHLQFLSKFQSLWSIVESSHCSVLLKTKGGQWHLLKNHLLINCSQVGWSAVQLNPYLICMFEHCNAELPLVGSWCKPLPLSVGAGRRIWWIRSRGQRHRAGDGVLSVVLILISTHYYCLLQNMLLH